MNTVLITGCSSGYGLETARHFHAHGWNVIATMRTPREDILPRSERLRVLALDVTKPESIAAAIEACGPVDVLVNNAGIGVVGVFEATPMATVREVFETNTFGVMAMTQAVLPQLRARRSGVVVNVTSSVTLAPMPLTAAYTASKMAIEGFTGSLAHELEAFNVRVKLVEPGYGPTTRFTRQRRVAHGRAHSRCIRAFRAAHPRGVCAGHDGDDRVRRGRGGVSRSERHVRATPVSRRCRRRGPGSVGMTGGGVVPAPTPDRAVARARGRPATGEFGLGETALGAVGGEDGYIIASLDGRFLALPTAGGLGDAPHETGR